MSSEVIFLFVFVIICVLLVLIWRRLRLRRALFVMWDKIKWSLKYAPRDKLVLDVGSGDNPHLRADVLCEKFLFDEVYRGGNIAYDRPLVAGDACALPFKTGVFDVLIASHLLGHLETPYTFFEEAGRVAKSGLFIAPSSLFEQLRSIPSHLWLVKQKGNVLHFIPKDQQICHPEIHEFFENKFIKNLLRIDHFMIEHWDSLIITYCWENKPECFIEGFPEISDFVRASIFAENAEVREHKPYPFETFRSNLKKLVRQFTHSVLSSHQKISLKEIIACPKCHGDVNFLLNEVVCANCDLRFPIENGIPIMLLDRVIVNGKQPEVAKKQTMLL